MTYNPKIHHRRSIRLDGYDYSRIGGYFVTICTNKNRCLFGDIVDGAMILNDIGRIVDSCWRNIPERFASIRLDKHTIMPNHIHGIIIVGAPLAGAQNAHIHRATARVAPTVGDVVGTFKSLCVKHCLDYIKHNESSQHLGKFWQRNYYEHVIRDHDDLAHIRQYIHTNPARWEEDENYLNK